MKKVFDFGLLFLFRPERAASECAREDALSDSLKIYALWVAASLAYLWLKPRDFPDANAPMPHQIEGLGFWLRVSAWEPLLAAINLALTAVVLEWMRDGWLPLKTAAASLWAAAVVFLIFGFTSFGLSRMAFGAGMVVWLIPGALVARRVRAGDWRKTAPFLLGLNAIGLLLLLPEVAATLLRSDLLYKATLVATVLWLLACGGIGLSKLWGISLARAILAFLFANVVLNLVIIAAFLLHWLPMEVLKVLLYV